ncbi:hypothetical protein CYJ89_02715 [Lactobacillus jensenii]|uniref:LPXTG cell wall anchor domain-containing protein n=1 Tax=Lactobacillus jensenii TaxID=109790 RepID=A0A5N1I4W1_LACJE|nr:LPXTG cell wall anchor domain-containing protein [Lactobacillus jensenii]KAA9259171.1 LPXTG cell wall anchor domain-containing protein [Lactobacillus jensenii]KAA9264372.1 LPXTG cell wall anchor domain-containing protein [Lactobacillus jensenii]KAA9320451.1 LPXTG cell wall anchor domain-containing protein [Lactobacillus jensenii]KAA9320673.1 LPXTG cell wall anchor domain-containing protein [Lactobacillus jensenii]
MKVDQNSKVATKVVKPENKLSLAKVSSINKQHLPQTGNHVTVLGALGMLLVSLGLSLGLKRKDN